MTVNIYLTFESGCGEAFNFYKSIFGGEFESISKFSEMPEHPDYPIKDEDKDKIMHVTLPISKETRLMGSDTASGFGPGIVAGNNFSIIINTESKEESDKVFNSLSEGGKVTMPLQDTFWESYFGSCTDKFGISWMVSCPI